MQSGKRLFQQTRLAATAHLALALHQKIKQVAYMYGSETCEFIVNCKRTKPSERHTPSRRSSVFAGGANVSDVISSSSAGDSACSLTSACLSTGVCVSAWSVLGLVFILVCCWCGDSASPVMLRFMREMKLNPDIPVDAVVRGDADVGVELPSADSLSQLSFVSLLSISAFSIEFSIFRFQFI